MVALIGVHRYGQVTLLSLLDVSIQPISGVVAFNDMPLSSFDARERAKRIAYVPQASPTVFPFTALEVVLTGRSPYSGRNTGCDPSGDRKSTRLNSSHT